ncbi:MAG TPA: MarR family transcriptional regulator [Ktedonobacterales bacterium]
MERETSPAAQNLLHAFMRFSKGEWRQRSIAGHTPSEIRLMFCVRQSAKQGAPEMNVSQLSRQLHVTSPSITQLINGLESDGLVERNADPTDKRAVCVHLTEEGIAVVQLASHAFLKSLQGLVEYLGEESSYQLADLLTQAFRYFDQLATHAPHDQQNGDEEA